MKLVTTKVIKNIINYSTIEKLDDGSLKETVKEIEIGYTPRNALLACQAFENKGSTIIVNEVRKDSVKYVMPLEMFIKNAQEVPEE